MVAAFSEPEDRILSVKFTYRRPSTGRKVSKTLRFNQSLTSDHSGKFVPHSVLESHVNQMIARTVFSPAFIENTPAAAIKAQILKNLRSPASRRAFAGADSGGGAGPSEPPAPVGPFPPWGAKGRLFAPTRTEGTAETGKSILLVGSSFSGKTHLFTHELNKLDPGEYDGIVLMTESVHAEPLRAIRPELNVVVLEGFQADVVRGLKAINDATENRYRWLVILDDIVDQKHSATLGKMLLTYRNSNITTALVVQYPGLVNKASRGSFHAVIMTGFRSLEDWEFVSKVFDLLEWARDSMAAADIELVRSKIRKTDAFRWLKSQTSEPGDVIYIDQKHSRDPVLWAGGSRRSERSEPSGREG